MKITQLRHDCRTHGIDLSIRMHAHGAHAKFTIDGISSGSVMSEAQYLERKEAFNALSRIKEKYHGVTYHGQHLYGLKPASI